MKCPVCPIESIPENMTVCPGCGTDVSVLQRIEGLGSALHAEAARLARDRATDDDALVKAAGALALDSRNVEARKLLGKLWWRKGQVREALQQWEKAATLAPGDRPLQDLVSAARQHLQRRSFLTQMGLAAAVLVLVVLAGLAFRAPLAAFFEAVVRGHGGPLP